MHSEISRPLLLSNYKNIFGTERQLCFKIDQLNYACMRKFIYCLPTTAYARHSSTSFARGATCSMQFQLGAQPVLLHGIAITVLLLHS